MSREIGWNALLAIAYASCFDFGDPMDWGQWCRSMAIAVIHEDWMAVEDLIEQLPEHVRAKMDAADLAELAKVTARAS